ncbi:MAG: hypothetical protein Q4A05_11595 [Ruminococcus sp.]|nr:hypothetical protein [Ruminococcus sp.]
MSKTRRFCCCLAVCLLSLFFVPLCALSAEAYERVHLVIPVICLDVEDLDDHIYRIKITTDDPFAPAPLSDTLDIAQNGTGQFEIDIDEPGTFVYEVFAPKGDEPDIDYEPTVYTITVYVELGEDDELLYAMAAAVDGRDVKSEEIQFQGKLMDGSDRKKPRTTETATVTTISAVSTTTTMTTTAAATTAATTTTKANPIVSFVGDVLTGDSFPAKALCVVILAALAAMVGALLLKKKSGDNDRR